ncbi:MAG: hypothetical protein ACXWIM_22590, partial [Burkholderiales bacterium]
MAAAVSAGAALLARAVTDRAVTLPHFAGESYLDHCTQDVMKRVKPVPFDERLRKKLGDSGAAIAVTLTDGRRLEGTIRRPVGHDAGVPLAPELHKAKFEACVERRLTPEQMNDLYRAVQSFERVSDVRDCTEGFESDVAA